MINPVHLSTWILFLFIVAIALTVDLFLHRKHIKMSQSMALFYSAVWISIALGFNLWIYFELGKEPALNFLASYLVEKSLSIDNLFVFLVIFNTLKITPRLRHKVLFWGIMGAFVMRALFISLGVALVTYFSFLLYVFGGFLIITGIKLALEKEEELNPEKHWTIQWIERHLPVIHDPTLGTFFVQQGGKWLATPLFIALIAIEASDLIFAIDSIPAVLGITTDPLIVFTSNIFAILGLRSLYFALEGLLDLFKYLQYGLAAILIFIGTKMLLADFIHVPVGVSLSVIASFLALSILASCKLKNL